MTGPEPALPPGPPPEGSEAPVPPYAPPTRIRSRKPLIMGVIVAAVLIVSVVLTVVLVGADSNSPKTVAQDYLTAAKNGDLTKLQDLTCDRYKSSVSTSSAVNAAKGISNALANITFEVTGVEQTGDSTATAQVKISYGAVATVTIPLAMVKEHGAWTVCTA
jgi:hypothetical protein